MLYSLFFQKSNMFLLFRWLLKKQFVDVHFEIWEDDPIWRAYFQLGWQKKTAV